jgi:hypothetical protein
MHEFDSVSVSSYEAATLAGKLTEKSGEGWDVVAIVPSGTEITAFLKRESSSAADTPSSTAASGGWDSGAATTTAAAAAEPAGWGAAPEAAATTAGGSGWGTGAATATTTATTADTTGGWGSSTTQPAATTPPTATPSVPAGWYADPAARFELRYWDGSAWTEHVSRAGQQYTDPPVA